MNASSGSQGEQALDEELLLKVARFVRAEFCHITMDRTLKNYCGDASYALRQLLLAEGLLDVTFCYGLFGSNSRDPDMRESHCWLEVGGKILDITAKQFGSRFPRVWFPAKPSYYTPQGRIFKTDYLLYPMDTQPLIARLLSLHRKGELPWQKSSILQTRQFESSPNESQKLLRPSEDSSGPSEPTSSPQSRRPPSRGEFETR